MGVRMAIQARVGSPDTAVLDAEMPSTSTGSGIASSVGASVLGKAAEMVTLLVLATVVPRALGPDAYGHLSVPLTIVTLGSLALVLGGPTVMARFVPTVAPAERPALAWALGARLALGRVLQLAVVALLATGAVLWDSDSFPPAETALVVVALALNVGATLLLQPTLGLGLAGPWSLRYPLQNTVLIGAVLVLHHRFGPIGSVWALVVAGSVAVIFGAAAAARHLRRSTTPVAIPDGALHFGVLHAAGAGLTQITQRGGVVAVALLASAGPEAGYTALALGVALGVTYAVLQAFTVSLPHLTGRSDGEDTARRLAGGLLAVISPLAVVVSTQIDELVPLVFGDGYLEAAGAFGPALALVVLAPLTSLLVQVGALRIRPGVSAAAGVSAVVAFTLVALLTVPEWGAAGGTTAALAGAVGGSLFSLGALRHAAGWRIVTASFASAAAVLALAASAT